MDINKPNEFAALVGVSVKTLQRWELKAYRSPSDRRYYTHKHYMGDGNSKHGKTIIYTRVSTANQKNDLLNQVAFLPIRGFERHGC